MNIVIRCKQHKCVPLSEFKPHPKNRNDHSKEQIDRLVTLFKYQGVRKPITVSTRSGCITAGHGRLLAAKQAKMKEYPVDYQDYDSEEQEYSDVQSDNAIALWAELDRKKIGEDICEFGPDYNPDLLGIKDFVIEPADLYADKDADAVPEVKEAITKPGDLWLLGEHKVLCADCTKQENIERLMNGEKADMVFTDPPYGVNERTMRKSAGRSKLAEDHDFQPVYGDTNTDTAKWISGNWETFGNAAILWGANYYVHSLLETPGWIVWDKRGDVASDDNADCELAWTSFKKPCRKFTHLWKGCIRESEKMETKVHPTQKPVVLAEWCFEKYGNPKTVLDGFLGSGSTLIACEKTNRKCYGMEIDAHYVDVIVKRFEDFTGQKAVLDA